MSYEGQTVDVLLMAAPIVQKFENLVINRVKEQILTYGNLKESVSLVNEEMDSAASDYRERLNVITVEIDNVNQ